MRLPPLALLLTATALTPVVARVPAPSPEATITLRPRVTAGAVDAIDVRIGVDRGATGAFTLTAPVQYPGVTGVADRIRELAVRDAAGPVTMVQSDDPAAPGGFPYFRHWKAQRAITYPVSVSYRAQVQPAGGPNGPAFGLRAVGGGAAAAGAGFLALPDAAGLARTRVRWDLAAFGKGAHASTSYGDGNFSMAKPPRALFDAWMMVGPLNAYPAGGAQNGFRALWIGTPTFDAAGVARFTAEGYRYLADYFRYLGPNPPYRVYTQFRDQPPYGGGTALDQSFMLSTGPRKPGDPAAGPRTTLFHEMIHQWVGQVEAPAGISSWFSEGLTTYYQDLLQMRGGFETVSDYQKAINELYRSYTSNPGRNMSAAAITKVGFGDEAIRRAPYIRGALYFHEVDAAIRERSHGKRSLQDLLQRIFTERAHGVRFDHARWIELISAELGEDAGRRFTEVVIDGAGSIAPRPDLFGPCFTLRADEWVRRSDVTEAACRSS